MGSNARCCFFIELQIEAYDSFPYGLTLTGQYIVKNFVLVTAALFLLKYSEQETAEIEAA